MRVSANDRCRRPMDGWVGEELIGAARRDAPPVPQEAAIPACAGPSMWHSRGRRAGHRGRTMDMPKMTERDRLADLEARQRKMNDELESARRALRGKYAAMIAEMPVEKLTEREFRELLTQAIRVGGSAALTAVKGLPAAS